MKLKLAALLFAAAGMLGAASWDGTKGDITLLTTSFSTSMPYLPFIPQLADFTMICVKTPDDSTVGFRVTVRSSDADGKPISTSLLSKRNSDGSFSVVAFPIALWQVMSVVIEKLFPSAYAEFSI